MRRPQFRLSVRLMMVVVAVLGVACLGGRRWLEEWWRRGESNPVLPSEVTARVQSNYYPHPWVEGRPIPVKVQYNFAFGRPKPAPGTTCLVLGMIWFEDQRTGHYVDGYTFDAPLTVGERETASGSFLWDATVPHPGRYLLRFHVYHRDAWGELRRGGGGGSSYDFVATGPAEGPPSEEGAKP